MNEAVRREAEQVSNKLAGLQTIMQQWEVTSSVRYLRNNIEADTADYTEMQEAVTRINIVEELLNDVLAAVDTVGWE